MSIIDQRVVKQAEILIGHSVKAKAGENVVILADFEAKPLVLEIYKKLVKIGCREIRYYFSSYEFSESFFKHANDNQIKHFPKIADFEIKNVDCYIAIRSSENTRGLTGTDAEKISLRQKILHPITDYRVEKTKWVITTFPTNAQAQEADMSLSNYSDFVFDAVIKNDWKKVFKSQEGLRKILDNTSLVRIKSRDTDLLLDISGRKAVNAAGEYNMPDGEVFTSVLENKANGYIKYTYPALYMGREFHDVYLEFKNGKVVSAKASKNEGDLNKILDMDKGARHIGELGIGNNFRITRFTKDILFDEKMGGTIHIALGKGYKENKSRNESGLHWDMIKDLRGGGELWFDKKLVQLNGKWRIKL
jgi:aminopeptidase